MKQKIDAKQINKTSYHLAAIDTRPSTRQLELESQWDTYFFNSLFLIKYLNFVSQRRLFRQSKFIK